MSNNSGVKEELRRLSKVLDKIYSQQSYFHTFIRGVLAGFGSVVGATIVVGIVVTNS